MPKWLTRILATLLVVLLLAVAVGFFLPTDYALSRSVVIAAEPAQIHAFVGDLQRWDDWSPWKERDPTIQTSFGEKTSGIGAHQSWSGDSGKGNLTVTASDAAKGVDYDMAFSEWPSKGYIHYKPVAGGTEVTWGMEGDVPAPVIGGYFALLMDTMTGPMFERGLVMLKDRLEQ